MTDRVNTVQ